MSSKYCVTHYLQNLKCGLQSPGLGDYIRGCLTLIKYCDKYNYLFFVKKDSHKMFNFLSDNKYFISDSEYQNIYRVNENVIEIFGDYGSVDKNINLLFSQGKNFNIITSGFYNYPHNYGEINENQRKIMKQFFTPNENLNKKLINIFKELNIIKGNYNVLKIRTGDKIIHNESILDESFYHHIYNMVKRLKIKEETVIVCDSNLVAKKLISNFNYLKYYETKKIHLGDRYTNSYDSDTCYIEDTLIDFFLLCYSKKITSTFSGFSEIASIIFQIPIEYCRFKDQRKYLSL